MGGASSAQGEALPLTVADWPQALRIIKEILDASDLPVPLSNIKRLFRSKYNVELSETALGAPKLSKLLQDERMQEVCSVELQKSGYVVHRATAKVQVQEAARPRQHFCQEEALCLEEVSGSDVAVSGWGAMSPSVLARCDRCIGGVGVKNTFIVVSDGSSGLRQRRASRRAQSVPTNFRSNRSTWRTGVTSWAFVWSP